MDHLPEEDMSGSNAVMNRFSLIFHTLDIFDVRARYVNRPQNITYDPQTGERVVYHNSNSSEEEGGDIELSNGTNISLELDAHR